MRKIISMCFALLLLSCPAYAGQFEDGKAAWFHLDYDEALRLFKPLADHGDARAQYMLGVLYFSGEGVPQDYAKARQWFLRAAGQGNKKAQGRLGLMYDGYYGGKQDFAEAYFWKLIAAGDRLDPVWEYHEKLSAQYLTTEQIESVNKRVDVWKKSHSQPPASRADVGP